MYWVVLGFTGFYWVLLGFTGFYWFCTWFENISLRIFGSDSLLDTANGYRISPIRWCIFIVIISDHEPINRLKWGFGIRVFFFSFLFFLPFFSSIVSPHFFWGNFRSECASAVAVRMQMRQRIPFFFTLFIFFFVKFGRFSLRNPVSLCVSTFRSFLVFENFVSPNIQRPKIFLKFRFVSEEFQKEK